MFKVFLCICVKLLRFSSQLLTFMRPLLFPTRNQFSRGFSVVFYLQPFYESTSFRIAYAIRVYRIFSLLSRIIIKLHQDIDLVSRKFSYSSDEACIHSLNDRKQPFLYYDLAHLDQFMSCVLSRLLIPYLLSIS